MTKLFCVKITQERLFPLKNHHYSLSFQHLFPCITCLYRLLHQQFFFFCLTSRLSCQVPLWHGRRHYSNIVIFIITPLPFLLTTHHGESHPANKPSDEVRKSIYCSYRVVPSASVCSASCQSPPNYGQKPDW